MFGKVSKTILALMIVCTFALQAHAAQKIRFGVPPWPGVMVKTEVVCQLLEAAGYPTERYEIGPPIIYKGMTSGEVDAFLAAWTPQQNPMLDPLVEKKEVEVVAANLDEASIGLCVPDFVWDAGVKSFADLDAHEEEFGKTVYDIEAGSGMHTAMEEVIANDVAGVGDWNHEGTTTSAMLSQVKDLIKRGKWAAFGCWKPHWMNIEIDMKYLEGVPGTEKYISQSIIYTVVTRDFQQQYPEVYKFFKKFKVPSEIQSRWIYDYGYQEVEQEKVATDWIRANMDMISGWFEAPCVRKVVAYPEIHVRGPEGDGNGVFPSSSGTGFTNGVDERKKPTANSRRNRRGPIHDSKMAA